ncbi:MAG: 1,4-alpha-glucan branching protein GlgB, partial [Sandaracinaceae bacterium]|nr:1,4-alpha-glucan branching protein GlgB [Sandaracinaceae bacterium]
YEKLGAHVCEFMGRWGTNFAVWAPHAESVSVIGSFNGWDEKANPLRPIGNSGVWGAFVPNVGKGALYKYRIRRQGRVFDKADPYGRWQECPPGTASIVWTSEYQWGDQEWMAVRKERNHPKAPISIYEVHIGSFQRVPDEGWRSLSYRELAPRLADHLEACGFTHVEFLPVMEHPFFGSWGYQITGYFAPTHRYGTPDDFKFLIDYIHQRGFGVILDWSPAHFPGDPHGLARFDGTCLYEHPDWRRGFHPDWKSLIFDYGKKEVKSFLINSACFWLEHYHVDGLRVDGVASMLYLDYSRKPGEWLPNKYGGREHLEAIDFLRELNETIARRFPDVLVIAEESTAWPKVTGRVQDGGLGFSMKWDLGWMHDTLSYLSRDPIYRRYHHNEITFRSLYAFSERFVLPLSHDEVVHGKRSLIAKMPGDRWKKFANLRLLFGLQFSMPGKKLIFMGGEIAQWNEWNHDGQIDWKLLEDPAHRGVAKLVSDLNHHYRSESGLHRKDCEEGGFVWVDGSDEWHSVIAFLRVGDESTAPILVVVNATPVVRYDYPVGVPVEGRWQEILNTDALEYGGSGVGNLGAAETIPEPWAGFDFQLRLTLPPLTVLWLKAPKAWVLREKAEEQEKAPEAEDRSGTIQAGAEDQEAHTERGESS